jgi:asparagine synthase (glutamine-hydrolysing)
MYDEPFADSSQIPTHLVCQAAREHVTVALSGDAGDELFGGYNRYMWAPRIWDQMAWLPYSVRNTLGGLIRAVPMAGWHSMSGVLGVSRLGDKAHKLAASLDKARDIDDMYWNLVREWTNSESLVIGSTSVLNATAVSEVIQRIGLPPGLTSVERMMARDTLTYLTDDILCKVDRAAMACSIETRVPFLDHRVVELAWRLPQHMKVRGNTGKWAMRQLLYKYVPRELIERPKVGFAVPIGQWMRCQLRDWAEDLLNEKKLREQGYLNPKPLRRRWEEHLSGRRDHTSSLWAILMFQSWLQAQEISS